MTTFIVYTYIVRFTVSYAGGVLYENYRSHVATIIVTTETLFDRDIFVFLLLFRFAFTSNVSSHMTRMEAKCSTQPESLRFTIRAGFQGELALFQVEIFQPYSSLIWLKSSCVADTKHPKRSY